jgi:uncharacterized protein (TIGR02246 family)
VISSNETEIRNLIEQWLDGIQKHNLDQILPNHSSDILMFDLPGPVQLRGIEAYKQSWMPLFNWLREDGIFDLSEINVTAGEDVAFATALIHCKGTEPNGNSIEIRGRLTIGLRKIDGQWIVTHEHHSEPSPD